MPSKKPRAVTPRFLLPFALAGLLLSTGCVSAPAPVTPIIPVSLRADCVGPPTEGVETIGQLAAFSVRQEAALQVCSERKAAVVAIVDAHRAAVTPRPWWKVWE